MRKPRTLIIDDNLKLLKTISINLRMLGHETFSLEYIDMGEIDKIKKLAPDLIILDQVIEYAGKPTTFGTDIAKKLQEDEKTRNIPKVIITAASKEEQLDIAKDALRSGLLKEVIGKQLTGEPNIEDLIRVAGYASVPLRLGFASLGRLAQKSIEILFKEYPDYVETVGGVSLTGIHKEEDIRRSLGIEDEPRFKVHNTLEELIRENYDVVLVSSSKGAESRVENGRNWLWNNEKAIQYGIWKEIVETELELSKKGTDAGTFYIIATNPIGANISLAEKLGIPTERITGLSVIDTVRAKKYLKQKYLEQFNEQINDKDIEVRVVGQHGSEIPVYQSIRIKGKSPEDLGLKIDTEKFIRDVREEGGKVMESVKNLSYADRYEVLYRGVPEAFVRLLGNFCKRKQPSESLYARRNIIGSVQFNGPAELNYLEAGMTIKPKKFENEFTEDEFAQITEQNKEELEVQEKEVSSYILEREKGER